MREDGFRCPDLWFGRFETVRQLTFGDSGLGQFEGLLQIIGLVQGLGEQGIAEVSEVGFLRATEGYSVGPRGRYDQGPFILEGGDEAAGVAGRNHDDLVAVFQGGENRGQFVGWQIGQFHARLVEHQFVFTGAVAGQVDENQVFRTAAFGQRQGSAAQVFPGSHRAVGEVVTMVHQADLAKGAKTGGEHVGDVVGFAQKHALLAITPQGQRIQLHRRRRVWNVGQRCVEQAALGQQAELQGVGQ
ncbi:hypothetical protein D3C86_1158540 [compost metagenome]